MKSGEVLRIISMLVFVWVLILLDLHRTLNKKKCKIDAQCLDCTTCFNGVCENYRHGNICNKKTVTKDLDLYYRFFYFKKILVIDTLCNNMGTVIKFKISPAIHDSNMTLNEYFNKTTSSISRIEQCNNIQWAFSKNN